ncbi:MAG TPA: arginase family protein [Candidatus Limnocylindrales bacterium]
MTVTILGVPTNSSGIPGGVANAPAALRRAGLLSRDIEVGSPAGVRGADGVIDSAALATTLARTRAAVAEARRSGHRVILLGGDCPVLIGGLAGCSDADGGVPGLLFVDGHEDAWPPHASTTGEAADMELGWLLGRGLDGLGGGLRAEIPQVPPERVAILGPRDRDEIAAAGIDPLDDLVPVIDDVAVVRDPASAAGAGLDRITLTGGPWWLHIDLDVLSTEALPAVDYRQPGGLGWSDLRTLTDAALDRPGCVGATVTIYNPDLDPGQRFAGPIASFVRDLAARLDRPPVAGS